MWKLIKIQNFNLSLIQIFHKVCFFYFSKNSNTIFFLIIKQREGKLKGHFEKTLKSQI